jgi:hypothetical protein
MENKPKYKRALKDIYLFFFFYKSAVEMLRYMYLYILFHYFKQNFTMYKFKINIYVYVDWFVYRCCQDNCQICCEDSTLSVVAWIVVVDWSVFTEVPTVIITVNGAHIMCEATHMHTINYKVRYGRLQCISYNTRIKVTTNFHPTMPITKLI